MSDRAPTIDWRYYLAQLGRWVFALLSLTGALALLKYLGDVAHPLFYVVGIAFGLPATVALGVLGFIVVHDLCHEVVADTEGQP